MKHFSPIEIPLKDLKNFIPLNELMQSAPILYPQNVAGGLPLKKGNMQRSFGSIGPELRGKQW
jgi:hypothetical protein